MQRELSTMPLHPSLRSKLSNAGFVTIEDVADLKACELSKDLGISANEAMDLLKMVHDYCNKTSYSNYRSTMTALDMIEEGEHNQKFIVTFSEEFDNLLGGGVPLEKLTEFCGPPGIGKTQICLQLAVDVQIPEYLGGVGGEAIYIDTEGSFVVERAAEIAEAAILHCQNILMPQSAISPDELMLAFNIEKVLSHIHYFRCHDYVQLIALVHTLDDFIRKHNKVKLIILDSIAFPFRQDFEDFMLRTRLLNGMVQSFNKLAASYKLAVVLTNQMTTRFNKQQTSQLVPALGESWGHACTIRVILFWNNQQRQALLYKSPSKKEAIVSYQITVAGTRDLCNPEDETAVCHETMMTDG